MYSHHVEFGVTLIELLVAVVIMAIVMAVGAPSFNQWVQNSQIKNAAGSIIDGLQLARAEAVRRNQNVQFMLGTASSWTVGCVTTATDCPSTIESRSASDGSTNAQVSADQSTIVFNGLGRVTPAPASTINVDVTNPTGGACVAASGTMRCLRVEVGIGGQVRMCDPSLASTDPKGC